MRLSEGTPVGVLIRNVNSEESVSALDIPTRPEGGFYRYEMICDGGWTRAYDDFAAGLLNHIIPNYEGMNEEERLIARIAHAIAMQVPLQAAINQEWQDTPRTPAEHDLLNGSRATQPVIEYWDAENPLVLVDAFYAPYTETPAPVSGLGNFEEAKNVWWLQPASSELEYLQSLHEASVITLSIAKDEAI